MIHREFLSYLGKGGIFMYIRMMKKVLSYVYKEIEIGLMPFSCLFEINLMLKN